MLAMMHICFVFNHTYNKTINYSWMMVVLMLIGWFFIHKWCFLASHKYFILDWPFRVTYTTIEMLHDGAEKTTDKEKNVYIQDVKWWHGMIPNQWRYIKIMFTGCALSLIFLRSFVYFLLLKQDIVCHYSAKGIKYKAL